MALAEPMAETELESLGRQCLDRRLSRIAPKLTHGKSCHGSATRNKWNGRLDWQSTTAECPDPNSTPAYP